MKEYVVLGLLPNDTKIKSLLRATDLQEATRKAVKLLPLHVPYRGVSIVEVMAGVTADYDNA